MKAWQPLEHVPDELHLGLYDALRCFVLQSDLGLGVTRDAEGLLVVPMREGTSLRVGLRPTTQVAVRFGPRAAIRTDFDGRAVWGRASYGLTASATLDVKTKAFVDLTCEILWRDGVAAGG